MLLPLLWWIRMLTILRTRSFWRSKNPNPRNSLVKTVNENGPPVRSATSERTQSLRFRNQIRGEVAVERRERSRVIGRGPEGDVSIGADQDQAARRDAGADGIDVGVVKDLHALGPASAQPRERLAKFKGHWEELQRGRWGELDNALREHHRADLLQVLAYSTVATRQSISSCLVCPCTLPTWEFLKREGRIVHREQAVAISDCF